MSNTNFLIKTPQSLFHSRKSFQSYSNITCSFHEEDFLWLGSKFEDHCCMIILRSTIGSDYFATRCVASEKKNIESVCQVNELLLWNLRLLPKIFSQRSCYLEFVTLRLLNMKINHSHPFFAFLHRLCFKIELSLVSFDLNLELISRNRISVNMTFSTYAFPSTISIWQAYRSKFRTPYIEGRPYFSSL